MYYAYLYCNSVQQFYSYSRKTEATRLIYGGSRHASLCLYYDVVKYYKTS